jgi:hypothetical protein
MDLPHLALLFIRVISYWKLALNEFHDGIGRFICPLLKNIPKNPGYGGERK